MRRPSPPRPAANSGVRGFPCAGTVRSVLHYAPPGFAQVGANAQGMFAPPRLLAPGRAEMTPEEGLAQLAEIRGALRAAGIGPEDRVGILLENGPDFATAIL